MLALLLLPFATQAQTVFAYSSVPGDYVGQGRTEAFTPENAVFRLYEFSTYIRVDVDGNDGSTWSIEIGAPADMKLTPGYYANSERTVFRTGRAAGLDVSGDSRGCDYVYGNLGLRQVMFDAGGHVTALEASFVQRCGSADAPPMAGVIRYNARKLSLGLRSDPGDYVGGGVDRSYFGDTSLFTLSGTSSSLRYGASGRQDNWTAFMGAPTGQVFKIGRYPIAVYADSDHAGLKFYGNGRSCQETSGFLDIRNIQFDGNGDILGLYATFVQHCEGAKPALRGVIHFGL
jgi:hypothetical protein